MEYGAFSQYQLIPERIVKQNTFLLPDSMNYETAALMEPLSCVTYGVENVGVQLGDTVVVNGTGPIGLMYIALLVKKREPGLSQRIYQKQGFVWQKNGSGRDR